MTATNQTKPKKKSYHHGDLRQQLLDKAAQLIREEGEEALSMRKLASELGVSRMAPYHHFADKQTLLCAIAEEGFNRFTRVLSGDNSDQDFSVSRQEFTKENLKIFITNYISFAVNHAEYYNLMFGGHLWKSKQLTESLKNEAHSSFRFYLDRIRKLRELELISNAVDPFKFAQISWSTLHGMSRLLIDGIYVDQSATDTLCDSAADSLWQLLLQPATD